MSAMARPMPEAPAEMKTRSPGLITSVSLRPTGVAIGISSLFRSRSAATAASTTSPQMMIRVA